jgi:hypothetical protein
MKWNPILVGQVVGGSVIGYFFFLIGGATGVVVSCPHGGFYEEWWRICIWGLAAYLFGVSLGVFLLGRLFRQEGSFGLTSLGSVLGGVGVYYFLLSPEQFAACVLVSLLAPLFATIGYHLRATGVVSPG